MASKKKSEWPPSGWKVEIKVSLNGRHYKCYINTKTGEKVYSKLAVLRCIKKGQRGNRESQSHGTKQHPKTKPENEKMLLLEANDSSNLPPGWTLEWKVRQRGPKKGTKYKCITDPSTGSKFYSMPEVYRYLKSRNGSAGSSKQAKGESITNSENNSSINPTSPQKSNLKRESPEELEPTIHDKLTSGKIKDSEKSFEPFVQTEISSGKMKVVVERTSDEDLPSGWVKEIRIRENGNNIRRDPFYIDPVTGLVFRSKLDALRYLETGDISRHAYRRKKNSIDEKESRVDKTSPTPPSNNEKTSKGGKRKHFIDEGSPTRSILVSLVAAGNNEAQSKRIMRSSLKVQSVVPAKPDGEVSVVPAQSKRITRSSSKVQFATTCEPGLEQIPLLPEPPAMTVQETLPAKADGQVSSEGAQSKRCTRSSAKIQSASTCESGTEQILLLPEPAETPQETVPVKSNREVSAVEDQSKRSTRPSSKVESSPTCEPNFEQIPLLPEPAKPAKPDGVTPVGTQSKRRTRSTKFQSADICEPSLEQIPLLAEPAQVAQEIVPAKHGGEVPSVGAQSMRRTRSTSKVQSTYICEPSLEQIPLLPEPAQGVQEIVPAKHGGEVSSVEARSKRRTRPSSQFQSASTCGPNLEQVPFLTEPAKRAQEMVPAKTDGEVSSFGAQSKRRRRSSAQVQPASMHEPNLGQIWLWPEPAKGALDMLPAKPNGAVFAFEAVGDVRQKVHVVDSKQNNVVPKETEPSTFPKHKSDIKLQGSNVRKSRINKSKIKDMKVSNLSSCSSKRLAEVEAEVPLHSIPIEHTHFSIENYGKTNAIPSLDLVPNESQQKAQALDDDRQNVLTSQQETYWAFDVNTPTVLHTRVDSVEKIDYLSQEYIEEIFLRDDGPPGFSQYPRTKITQSTIDQLFEDSVDTMPEDTIEKPHEEHKTPEEHKIPEEQQDTPYRTKIDKSSGNFPVLEEPTTLGRNNAQPGSQFCFPSPLWADPCLEFAFKTLTGVLPLDDNVAIQDYMEHQIRTCDQVNNQRSPDIGMSSFCQDDEAKLAPRFSDDASFVKSNGFNSHKPSR